jgi:two-component system LytT family response regulator
MNVLVVDDEKRAREGIVDALKLYCPEVESIETADGVKTAAAAIKKSKPDVILLDIQLKDGSGFDLIEEIGQNAIPVIFITAHEEFAIKAFQVSALHYLLKPIDPDELAAAMKKAFLNTQKIKLDERLQVLVDNAVTSTVENKKIVLKTLESIYVVEVADIVYCEADKNYTTFYFSKRPKVVVSKSIGEYEAMLPNDVFLRIHQSILLNLNYLERYEKGDGGFAITSLGHQLPVSTRKKDQLMAYLNSL